jgi:hypothetical protein
MTGCPLMKAKDCAEMDMEDYDDDNNTLSNES